MIYGCLGSAKDVKNYPIGTVAQCFFKASLIRLFVDSVKWRPFP